MILKNCLMLLLAFLSDLNTKLGCLNHLCKFKKRHNAMLFYHAATGRYHAFAICVNTYLRATLY
nr:MAG TPA: hypothetical protein [Caudoviricetes sp.]